MPAKTATLFDLADGKILARIRCEEAYVQHQVRPGQGYVEGGFDSAEFYVLDGAATPRPEMPASLDVPTIAADGVDTATVSGVPVGAIARIAGGPVSSQVTVDDGSLEVTADLPGTYTVRIEAFPHRDKEFTIVAS